MRLKASLRSTLLLTSSFISLATVSHAQDASEQQEKVEEVVVVGSRLKNSMVTKALPVTVVNSDQIAGVGAVSGDELFRAIPQMGDVQFNSTNGQTSSNFARGDVGSVNLRNLGIGNTLVLLNGRRVVPHPSSQADDNLVPVLTYNTNAIPVSGLRRLEVLRDGAAALYGTDAVAGVVNTVLRDDVDGGEFDVQFGGAEDTKLTELNVNGLFGKNFAKGRGNVSLFVSYTERAALRATDQDFTTSSDRRTYFANTPWASVASLDRRSTLSGWGDFQVPASFGTVRSGTTAMTSAAGFFHIQPAINGGCQFTYSNGLCIDDGTRATSAADRNTRSDSQANINTTIIPELTRLNLFSTSKYTFANDVTFFSELGYYQAETTSVQDSVFTIGAQKIMIPTSNYWNPFGRTTFANGQTNPNRIANLNISAAGAPVSLYNYRFSDLGPTTVRVKNEQYRVLAGLRGTHAGFDWESALLYSEATVDDRQDAISATLLQQNLALSTTDAYNPFNGGNLTNPTGPDTTTSNLAAAKSFIFESVRKGKSTLALWDFKASKSDLFALPAGEVGLAVGIEFRKDSQLDDRDPHVDGTITFTDSVTGEVNGADMFGVSPTPDTYGKRAVGAGYFEFAVPVFAPDMGVPLMRSLDFQIAGRFENYSDFGSVFKPKVAMAWDLIDGVRIRGSWAQGFRAPNLEQVNATLVTRGNSRTDFIRCEADLRAGRISAFSACSQSFVTTAQRSGNPDLQPEESETRTVGIVVQPTLPEAFGQFTLTTDYWEVDQTGIVGLFGEGNALILDYLLRLQGSSNPDVIRKAANADDIALFNGTGITPVGQVLYVKDQYRNLAPQSVRGIDLGLLWNKRTDRFGRFDVSINATQLLEFYRSPSEDIAKLIAARAAGQINAGTSITGGGDLIAQDSRPEIKWSGSLTWKYANVTVGAFTQYVSEVNDTDLVDASGNPWIVEAQTTANLYVQYEFKDGWARNTRVKLGVRNLTDEKPPLDSSTYGYMGSLYSPYARYWYASVRKSF